MDQGAASQLYMNKVFTVSPNHGATPDRPLRGHDK